VVTRQIMWQKRREKGSKAATFYLSKATKYLSNNMPGRFRSSLR
jgi:hypothetical protein